MTTLGGKMKGSSLYKLIRRVSFLLHLNIAISTLAHQQPIHKHGERVALNFDSLFVATPYKKAFDTCMLLIADLKELQFKSKEAQHQGAVAPQISVDVTDFLVGKLFRLKLAIDSFKESKYAILAEDLASIKEVIGSIDGGIRTLVFDNNDESVQLITDLVADIQGTLEIG